MGGIYTLFAVGFLIISTAAMLKGAGKVINQAAGGTFGVNHIVLAMTATFIVYSFLGGLVASAWTDVLQGFLIIVLSFLLIPLGWSTVGGMAGMRSTIVALPIVAGYSHGDRYLGNCRVDAEWPHRHHGPASHSGRRRDGQEMSAPVVSASSTGTTLSACVPRVGLSSA